MLNWIVWNRADYSQKNGFCVKKPAKIDMPFKPNRRTSLKGICF